MADPKTIKIKPSHPSQGDFVLINEDDFDPAVHQPLEPVVATPADPKADETPADAPADVEVADKPAKAPKRR